MEALKICSGVATDDMFTVVGEGIELLFEVKSKCLATGPPKYFAERGTVLGILVNKHARFVSVEAGHHRDVGVASAGVVDHETMVGQIRTVRYGCRLEEVSVRTSQRVASFRGWRGACLVRFAYFALVVRLTRSNPLYLLRQAISSVAFRQPASLSTLLVVVLYSSLDAVVVRVAELVVPWIPVRAGHHDGFVEESLACGTPSRTWHRSRLRQTPPKIVTRSGSPPKYLMYFDTH